MSDEFYNRPDDDINQDNTDGEKMTNEENTDSKEETYQWGTDSQGETNQESTESHEASTNESSDGQEADGEQRIYRVNEEYVEPQSDSQYRFTFDQGSPAPSPEEETPAKEKKKGDLTKKLIGVAIAVVVFGLIAGGLMLASNFISSGESDSGSSSETVGLSYDDADEETEDTDADDEEDDDTTTSSSASLTISTTEEVSASLMDVSDVVEEVMPTVVAVTNTTIYSVSSSYWSWYGDSTDNEYTASGVGSGVILADNGEELLIVTNAHVVNPTDYSEYGYTVDESEITVTFCNDVTVEGNIKGMDTDTDLAIIAVDLELIDEDTLSEIKIATVGNSDELKVGNGVIAIGNALGFGQSVTVGYVSAVNREVTIDGVTRELLQTDAAINPGNSGGGLFDTNGRLIGINSAKYSSEDVEGIGYAIPITSVEDTLTELMNQETVVREKVTDEDKMAWLGVAVSSQYRSFYDGTGAFISEVTEGSPADEAGLMAYDIIIAINDTEITSWDDLVNELEYYEGGETVTITYYTLVEDGRNREYVERTVEVTLGYKTDMPTTDETEEAE